MPRTRVHEDFIYSPRLDGLAEEAEVTKELSIERKNPDADGVYTLIEWRRPDGTLYKKSELSGGAPPQYSTRTVTYYAADGETAVKQVVYSIIYNDSGELVSEVVQSV